MGEKKWWKFTFKINDTFEEIAIWKLHALEIFTFALNYPDLDKTKKNLQIWLPELNWNKRERKNLENIFIDLCNSNGHKSPIFSWHCIQEEDWLNNWKTHWNPELIGRDFLVLPYWHELSKEFQTKNVIKIDPGAAFGTGSHPSTALCLEAMELISLQEKKILDIGCGSGILTIGARQLGAVELHSIDSDYLAINSTKENLKLNFNEAEEFFLYEGVFPEIISKHSIQGIDVILCNILADVIKKIIPSIVSILNANGQVILSGIISTQSDEIIKILKLHYLKIDNVSSRKDWVCIRASK